MTCSLRICWLDRQRRNKQRLCFVFTIVIIMGNGQKRKHKTWCSVLGSFLFSTSALQYLNVHIFIAKNSMLKLLQSSWILWLITQYHFPCLIIQWALLKNLWALNICDYKAPLIFKLVMRTLIIEFLVSAEPLNF